MSSMERRKASGLYFVLAISLVDLISASEETCIDINGQVRCYFKVWEFQGDWNLAWQLCNSRNSTLPVIRDRNEQDVFTKFLTDHLSDSVVWTSGRKYTYDDWTWVDGRPDYYEFYVFFRYYRYHPLHAMHYICQYKGDLCNYFNDTSDHFDVLLEYFNHTSNVTNGCMRQSNDTRSWYEARNQCIVNGGDLAVLEETDLLVYMRRYRRFRHMLWFGLREKSWRWNLNKNASEAAEIKYTNWSKNWTSLNGDCISIDALNGTWWAINCSEKLNVVCQTDFVNMTSNVAQSDIFLLSSSIERGSVSYATFISVVIVGICLIVISNIIVALVFRNRNRHEAQNMDATDVRRYQDLETTQRQANPDDETYTNIQLQPVYEEVCSRGK